MPQQTLQTERITLVPLADEHLEWEVELDSDFEVMRYLSGRASTPEEVAADNARRIAVAQKVDGLGLWVGLVDGEFVGSWVLQPAHGPDQPDDPGVADLGYRLLPRHWRKGLASPTCGRSPPPTPRPWRASRKAKWSTRSRASNGSAATTRRQRVKPLRASGFEAGAAT